MCLKLNIAISKWHIVISLISSGLVMADNRFKELSPTYCRNHSTHVRTAPTVTPIWPRNRWQSLKKRVPTDLKADWRGRPAGTSPLDCTWSPSSPRAAPSTGWPRPRSSPSPALSCPPPRSSSAGSSSWTGHSKLPPSRPKIRHYLPTERTRDSHLFVYDARATGSDDARIIAAGGMAYVRLGPSVIERGLSHGALLEGTERELRGPYQLHEIAARSGYLHGLRRRNWTGINQPAIRDGEGICFAGGSGYIRGGTTVI